MIQEIIRDTAFLARKAEPATPADLPVAQDLLDTLTAHKDGCVGMAANMIGVNKCIIAFDNEGSYMVLFNPQIIKRAGPYEAEEGCLSLPELHEEVSRPCSVVVRYFDENFNEKEELLTGLRARVFQHEFDHLQGKVFVDRLSSIRRTLLKRKLNDISSGRVATSYKMKRPNTKR